ncbi:sulfotransferase [Myxococcota bacterium]|nr:sulfotransferase [Myxococcota bacterium]
MSAPVLVLGTGRCGSTLLSEILRDHPTILSVSELIAFVTDLGSRIPEVLPRGEVDGATFWSWLAGPQPLQSTLLAHGLRMKEVIYPFERGRFAPEALPPILQATLPHLAPDDPDALYDALAAEVPSWPTATAADQYRRLFVWLCQRLGRRVWAERSGGGLRVAPRLIAAFPEAKIVHLVRDGRNTALSMASHIGFRMAFVHAQLVELLGVDPFRDPSRRDEEDLSDELAALLPESFSKRAFEAFDLSPVVCGHYWSGEITLGLNALDAVAPERVLTLRYEDLCADPKTTLTQLGRFLEEELDPVWLEVAAARVGQGTSAWERLPAREAAELDEACRPGFEALAARGIPRERPR